MIRIESLIKAAALALLLHGAAQAGPPILASAQGSNCTVTVTLNSLTASFFGSTLTYTFIPVSGGANIAFSPPQTTLSFLVPGGSYTLWITVGAYTGQFGQTSSAGISVTVAPCPLSSTGIGDACTTLKAGDVDPHWQLAYPFPSAPSGTTPLSDDPSNPPLAFGPVYVTTQDPAWFVNNGASQWITPAATATSGTATAPSPELGGEYVYRITFSTSATSLNGLYWSDNEVLGVYLNSSQIMTFPLNTASSFGPGTQTHFTIAPVAGVNTLDFVVRNRGTGGIDSQPTVAGLRVEFLINGCQKILPQFVHGGGWYTALYFTNTGSASVSFPVAFFADAGTPLSVPSVGGSSTTVNLSSQGTTIIEAPNAGSLAQGYVSAVLPSGVVGYSVFRQSVPGIADQEAVVPFSPVGTSTATLIWDDTVYTTAVAIANPTNNAETVTITVLDSSGTLIGSSSVSLPANGKTEAALRTLPGLTGMVGNRGSASFTVTPGGSITVLGLRFNGSAFTSIPLTAQ
jgi:hypothetical protein